MVTVFTETCLFDHEDGKSYSNGDYVSIVTEWAAYGEVYITDIVENKIFVEGFEDGIQKHFEIEIEKIKSICKC